MGDAMEFINKEHFSAYLKRITYLGQGCQGICYLDISTNTVIKVFNDYFANENAGYAEEYLLRFSSIRNTTFIWPNNVIKVGSEIVGYTMPYKKAKNLCNINPLLVNLDRLEEAIIKAEKDVKLITDNNVKLYDVRYNILYIKGKIYIIDTLDYSYRRVSFRENKMGIDEEIMLFLVDNYFDDFVQNDRILSAMYMEYAVNSLDFLRQFRNKLNMYLGKNITRLNEAKKLVRKNDNHIYQRGFNIR